MNGETKSFGRGVKVATLALVCLGLAVSVACSTGWTKTAIAILEAAQPAIHNIAPSIEPEVSAAISGLKAWKGDAGALANIAGEVQVALDNLDALMPKLDDHQKQLAVWIGSGLQSVLVVIEQNVPLQAHPSVKARAVSAPKYSVYPDADSYKKAKPAQ